MVRTLKSPRFWARRSSKLSYSKAKNASIAALSPATAIGATHPISPCAFMMRWWWLERNCRHGRSERLRIPAVGASRSRCGGLRLQDVTSHGLSWLRRSGANSRPGARPSNARRGLGQAHPARPCRTEVASERSPCKAGPGWPSPHRRRRMVDAGLCAQQFVCTRFSNARQNKVRIRRANPSASAADLHESLAAARTNAWPHAPSAQSGAQEVALMRKLELASQGCLAEAPRNR